MSASKAGAQGKKKISILIVEDSSFDAKLVSDALATNSPPNQEYVVALAESLADVKKLTARNKFHVIILDLFLPDSEGLDTLKQVKSFAGSQPVVVLSSHDDKKTALLSLQEGAQEYLIKGQTDLKELPYIIIKAMERERLKNEMEKAIHQAEKATKLKDKFVSLVMHDLTTPLAVIQGSLTVIHDDKRTPLEPLHKKLIEKVMASADQMLKMTSELLGMSRLNSGELRPDNSFVNMNDVAKRAISRYEPRATTKKIKIVNELPKKSRIYTDPELLEIVIKNLVSNAVKFCKEGDTVTVFSPEGKSATLGVKDTGSGISESDLPGLFAESSRTSQQGTAGETGTGLGLPFSNKIVNALGGKLEVKSVLGKGSAFYVILPEVKPQILIVDDDELMREVCKGALETLDVNISEAADSLSAVAKIKKDDFHLITIDINMPGKDGFELLKLVRSHPKTRNIPVIMVTSDKNIDTRTKAFSMGADDFVCKPIQKDEFLPRIVHLLSGSVPEDEGELTIFDE